MASQYGKPIEGERHTPKYPRDYPALPSGLQPLPFYPNLKRELRSVTGALVLTYLEIYHPPSQDASGALLSAPVTLLSAVIRKRRLSAICRYRVA
jgi:hypothetical protein